jgi:hypothetical protein
MGVNRLIMALSHSPSIVTDGLVLCVDAGNPRSYPGSGTVWNDATSSGFNFTLINGPTYSSSNLGSFTFDGVNDIATAGYNTALDTQTPTVEVWVKTNATTQNGFWFEKGAVNSQYSLFQEGGSIKWRMNIGGITELAVNTASVMNTSNWFQVVGTYTSGSRILYVNGVQVGSNTQTGTIATSTSGMSIGAYGGNSGSTGYFYNGNIGIVRVYNKVLSANEVMQNFNATRGRYGI